MKERYLNLMERALSAYTLEHMHAYMDEVRANGMLEHGLPRLASNIGILMAHGKRQDLLPTFIEMMDLCCKETLIPYPRRCNEFTVRELLFCIHEVETAGIVAKADIDRWKGMMNQIVPENCYDKIVHEETDRITNWAIFGAVSEYTRHYFGLDADLEFVDRQLSCQFQWLDENGMYRDNEKEINHQPMVYDLVSRGLFAILLHLGYRGKYYERIDACIKKAALLTLKMQSCNGELPYGGRSNQFMHNEAWLATVYEYEANRYAGEGNMELACKFKSAADRALQAVELWLNKDPIRHIKNRYPTETKYGTEKYAHFNKYMITVASFLYTAYMLCNESIPMVAAPDVEPEVFQTSMHFHKVFLKSGGYALEIDTCGDPKYETSGLGRVHKTGAPSTICMSHSCPAKPRYVVDVEETPAVSICPGVMQDGQWLFGADTEAVYTVKEVSTDSASAYATIDCTLANGAAVETKYTVNASGASLSLLGDGKIACMLPAFCFDGDVEPQIIPEDSTLTVVYDGWRCRYTTDGAVVDLGLMGVNRNGHYRAFAATGENALNIKIEIVKALSNEP